MKTPLYTFVIILLLSLDQAVYARHEQPPVAHPDPAQSLQSTLSRISTFHNSGNNKDAQALRIFIGHEIMPRFAFQTMAHWIAGPFSRYMTANDEADFVNQIKTDFQGFLESHLGKFDPEASQVRIYKTRFMRADKATVAIRVSFHQRQPVTLSFAMQWLNSQWKVVDIRSNGTSLVLYYRARFSDQLRAFRH